MVAALGLGLAALGRPAYITTDRAADLPADRPPAVMRARTHEMLDAAVSLGVRYVDAARGYGAAEEFLASWVATAADVPFVASKWGYRYTADWRADATRHEEKDHSRAMLDRQWAETTALLGPWLRLYQVHSLTLNSPLFDDAAVLARLGEIRAQGVEVGFSTSGPDQAAAVRRGLALTVDGAPLFTSVQSTWNLLEPSAGDALAEAHAAGVRVVVKEALANGLLAGHPALAGEHPADRLALAAALAQPWADVVLTGAVTVSQLESNVGATGLVVDPDAFGALATPPAAYWAARSRRAWA
ncbi:aldo/keto reductase [Nakamurella deserti]|uniref:aldo/keto reductase n=1 Tax=Nakamurella deserti TaxID=2164074 RepID=UPI0014784192|nr:aldo/keto reductase [Nakamurella deserti]